MQTLIDGYLLSQKGRLKPSTFVDYQSTLRHHLAGFSSLDDLNERLEAYLSGLDVSGKRRNNILSVARSLMIWARRRKLWSGDLYSIPRFKFRSCKILPLTPQEVSLIMRYAPAPYCDFFHFALLTGARTGESLGLRFEDFDLARGIIAIKRSFSAGVVSSTKSFSSDRELPLLRPLKDLFLKRKIENVQGSPWFFYSRKKGILSRGKLSKVWKGLLSGFGIAARPLYATRHSFASLAIASGEDPLWVAKTLGHSRPDLLFLRYGSFLEGVKNDGEKVASLILGGPPTLMHVVE